MNYKFIDCNCILGIQPTKSNDLQIYKKEDIKNLLKSSNVIKSFATHINAIKTDNINGNKLLLKEIENDDFFLPVFVIYPNHSDDTYKENELENTLKNNNIKLIRMCPAGHRYPVGLWAMEETLDILNKLKMPILISSNEISFDELYNWLNNFKNIKVILTDNNFMNTRYSDALLKKCDNFYVDTTYVTPDGIEYVTNKFGSERILFSSCAPYSTPAGYAGRIIMSDISDSDKENIAYKNILRLTGVEL